MILNSSIKLGFKDVLIVPKRSTLESRSQVDITRHFKFKYSSKTWSGIPIIAANMATVGSFKMAEALYTHNMLTAIHKHYSFEQWHQFLESKPNDFYDHFMITTGLKDDNFSLLKKIIAHDPKIKFICIDVANGYTERFARFVSQIREAFPDKIIIAGNVVTSEMTEQLILSGADIVKVGIGSGSVCTTRLKTGVGYPQLSAIIECADAAHGLGGKIISDGGCSIPGDISKAFAAGSDFVMLGGMLAAHKESEGNIIEENGIKKIEFYGMSSNHAMKTFDTKTQNYRASEGKRVLLPFKGDVKDTVTDILGGLRSTCTYVGALSLQELSKRTTFIRVQEQANMVFSPFDNSN